MPSDHEDQVLSDREDQVLSGHEENVPFDDSDGEYEEEEAVSRTINEDLSPTTLDDVSNQEFGSFHGEFYCDKVNQQTPQRFGLTHLP